MLKYFIKYLYISLYTV
uniref:Uncharacterized protein n=1 Tax=Anguilla anguilla TaxID=7936 RepID=A0A0E9UI33_ANGAN